MEKKIIQVDEKVPVKMLIPLGLYRCNKRKSTGVPGFQFCISGSGGAGH